MTDSAESRLDSLEQQHATLKKLVRALHEKVKKLELLSAQASLEKRSFEDDFRRQLEGAVTKLSQLSDHNHDVWRDQTLQWHNQVHNQLRERLDDMGDQLRHIQDVAQADLRDMKKELHAQMSAAEATYERIQCKLGHAVNTMETRFEQFERQVDEVHDVLRDVTSRQSRISKVSGLTPAPSSSFGSGGQSPLCSASGLAMPRSSVSGLPFDSTAACRHAVAPVLPTSHAVTPQLLAARAVSNVVLGAARREASRHEDLRSEVEYAQSVAVSVRGRSVPRRIEAAQHVARCNASSRSNSVSSISACA